MFTLEEKTREWERRHPQYARRATPENEARYAEMCEQVAELAEMAEEAALSELAAFGSCQGWFFGSAEAPIVYETGFELWEDDRIECLDEDWNATEEWLAWDAASEDIPRFFEMNLSI